MPRPSRINLVQPRPSRSFLLYTQILRAPISVVAGPQIVGTPVKHRDDVASTTHVFPFTVAAGTDRKLIVQPAYWHAAAGRVVSGVTLDIIPFARIDAAEAVASSVPDTNGVGSWFLDDADYPPPGTYNIVVTYNGSVSLKRAAVFALTDARQGVPVGASQISFDSAAVIQQTIVTPAADALILAAVSYDVAAVVTPDAGQTIRQDYQSSTISNAWTTEPMAVAGSEVQGFTSSPGSGRQVLSLVAIVSPQPPTMYRWDGDAWVDPGILNVWNGSAWVEKPLSVEV